MVDEYMLVKAGDADAMTALEEDFMLMPIGSARDIKETTCRLFPGIHWKASTSFNEMRETVTLWSTAEAAPELHMTEEADGNVSTILVVADRAEAERVAKILNLAMIDPQMF